MLETDFKNLSFASIDKLYSICAIDFLKLRSLHDATRFKSHSPSEISHSPSEK